MATTDEELERVRAGTGMGGRLRNLYAEDETEVARMRQARQQDDEMATAAGRWRAAQRLFGGQPEGPAPRPSTASERMQEESALRQKLGARREQARETDSLAAYLQREGVDPETAAVMARNPRILQSWEQGRGRQEEREFRRQMAQEERDWRAGESAKDRAARLRAAREAAASKKEPDRSKAATDLRKEFTAHPVTKRYQDVKISYDKVKRAANSGTAAGDLSLIFGFMKLLDPGSVVREGEFATAQNAAGVPDRIRNAYNAAIDGQRLNPEQRKQFVDTARDAFAAEEAVYRQQEQLFRRLAETQGLDPANVIGGTPRPTQGGNVDLTQPASGAVRMRAPDGRVYEIDPSEAQDAIANGWEAL